MPWLVLWRGRFGGFTVDVAARVREWSQREFRGGAWLAFGSFCATIATTATVVVCLFCCLFTVLTNCNGKMTEGGLLGSFVFVAWLFLHYFRQKESGIVAFLIVVGNVDNLYKTTKKTGLQSRSRRSIDLHGCSSNERQSPSWTMVYKPGLTLPLWILRLSLRSRQPSVARDGRDVDTREQGSRRPKCFN